MRKKVELLFDTQEETRMAALFGRSWRVVLTQGNAELTIDSSSEPEMAVDASISKAAGFEPNTCDLTIYGLGRKHRELYTRKGTRIEIYAGYQDTGAALLFRGSVLWGQQNWAGVERAIALSSVDGFAPADCTVTVQPRTPYGQVIDDVRGQAAQDKGKGTMPAAKTGGRPQVYEGDVQEVARQLSRESGSEITVQDGAWLVVPEGGAAPGVTYVIAPNTGLMGTPTPIKAGFGNLIFFAPGWNFDCRLNGMIRPMRPVKLVSSVIPGGSALVTPRMVRHTIQTRGDGWTTSAEAFTS
jgi:hypothetical protein